MSRVFAKYLFKMIIDNGAYQWSLGDADN